MKDRERLLEMRSSSSDADERAVISRVISEMTTANTTHAFEAAGILLRKMVSAGEREDAALCTRIMTSFRAPA